MVDAIPILNPRRKLGPFETIYSGWLMKRGHHIKNLKRRFFVLKGCVMMYYQTDMAHTQDIGELPKGVHIITNLRDITEKGVEHSWVIDTLDGKDFVVIAPSAEEEIEAVGAMKLSIQAYHQQFSGTAVTQNVGTALGIALCNAGYLNMAIDKLESVVGANPKDADGFYHLGTIKMMLNTDEGLNEASEALQKCIELDNNHINALANLGVVLMQQLDYDGAYKALSAVLAHTPTQAEAANNLAILLVNRQGSGDLEQAETRIQYAIQCDQTNAGLYLTYCDILVMMGNREGAMETLQRGIDASIEKNCLLNFRAGELLLEDGELEGAIESLKEAVDIDPSDRDALDLLQWTLSAREEQMGGGSCDPNPSIDPSSGSNGASNQTPFVQKDPSSYSDSSRAKNSFTPALAAAASTAASEGFSGGEKGRGGGLSTTRKLSFAGEATNAYNIMKSLGIGAAGGKNGSASSASTGENISFGSESKQGERRRSLFF